MADRTELITELKAVRAQALDHYAKAIAFSKQRKALIERLLADGMSRAEIGRELGVSRQAVRKMLDAG